MGKTDLFVYGASGHGKVVADIALQCGYTVCGYIDDGKGKDALSFDAFLAKHPGAFVALGIGINTARSEVFKRLKQHNIRLVTLVHPSAVIAKSARIGEGSVVMGGAVVNPDALIERGCIINSSAVVEHDNVIDEFVHISPGVALAGDVNVGAYAHVGIGASVIQGIRIGSHTIVGAGSAVIRDLPANVTAVGVPAKVITRG